MKIYKYESYEDYVAAQTEANVRKIKNVWVKESTISDISKNSPFASAIICHGTRNATEQKYFKKYFPNAEIIGTEISYTAKDFPMTVQHDFHELLQEWNDHFDILYSNSFDHSYDPEKCLSTWKSQIHSNGRIYIEISFNNDINRSKKSDPLEISESEFLELADSIGLNMIGVIKTNNRNGKVFIFKK